MIRYLTEFIVHKLLMILVYRFEILFELRRVGQVLYPLQIYINTWTPPARLDVANDSLILSPTVNPRTLCFVNSKKQSSFSLESLSINIRLEAEVTMQEATIKDHAGSKPGSVRLSTEEASRTHEPVHQNVTSRMIVFSMFIALIGWVFNFDLSEFMSSSSVRSG